MSLSTESDNKTEAATGIGMPLHRLEDYRFLTGRGRFLADLPASGMLHCHILRSPHAAARIRRIDCATAQAAAGVVAIFTGADMEADGVGPMSPLWSLKNSDGSPLAEPPRWALARGAVRHVGEPVVAIVAEALDQAQDAAELISVDYETLPAVTDARDALAAYAPRVHPTIPGNLCLRFVRGDATATELAFAQANHITRVELANQRLAGAAMENRAVIADINPVNGKPVLYSTTQTPHLTRHAVTEELGLPEGALRVIAPDVGGGFGYKGKHYPEETIMPWAALRLGRPVHWISGRDEAFISDTQGRDHRTVGELALDADGNFLGLRVTCIANIGAYVSTFGANIPTAVHAAMLIGVYRTPAIAVQIDAAFTNTVPTDAYRGAGRPEASYLLERLVDQAARTGHRPGRTAPTQSDPARSDALHDPNWTHLRLR